MSALPPDSLFLVLHRLPFSRRKLKEGLTARGHRVVLATTLPEALAQVAEAAPAVIVIDPAGTTAEELAALRQVAPAAKVALEVADRTPPEQVQAWVTATGAIAAAGRGLTDLLLQAIDQGLAGGAATLQLDPVKRRMVEGEREKAAREEREDALPLQALLAERMSTHRILRALERRFLAKPSKQRSQEERDLLLLMDFASLCRLHQGVTLFFTGDFGDDTEATPAALERAGLNAQAEALRPLLPLLEKEPLPGSSEALRLEEAQRAVAITDEDVLEVARRWADRLQRGK